MLQWFTKADSGGRCCITEENWANGDGAEVRRFILEYATKTVKDQTRGTIYFRMVGIELPDYKLAGTIHCLENILKQIHWPTGRRKYPRK